MKKSKKSKKLTLFGVELKEDKFLPSYYDKKGVAVRPYGVGYWEAEIETGDIWMNVKATSPTQALRKLERRLLKMQDKLDAIVRGEL